MVRAEYEHVQDGTFFRTVEVRTDLHIDVDADGNVLGVERIGDDVRARDLEDALRCCRYPLGEGAVTATDRTALGDRMKRYEVATRTVLPRRTYTIIRVDGRAFHTYLRGAAKPFDETFMADMDAVAVALCTEISGSVFAYTQSDEISVLAVDFQSNSTEPWFGGEVQKIVSISAATATAALGARRRRPGTFDARVFTIADPVEVANYFLWRQRDAVRNSIAMAAQAHFSHRQLHGVGTGQMQELLWVEKGVNWNDYPDGCKRGRVVVRESGERAVTFTHKRSGEGQTVVALRSWWGPQAAPRFTMEPDGFLSTTIPAMPMLRYPIEENQ